MTDTIVQLILAFACGYAFAKNSEQPPQRGSLPFMRGGRDFWNSNPPKGPPPKPPAAPPPPPEEGFVWRFRNDQRK